MSGYGEEPERNYPRSFFIALIFVFIVWVLVGLCAFFWPVFQVNIWGGELGERGTFGDAYGSINALFTGAAFSGVVISILMQRDQVNISKKELAETRETLRNQVESLNVQNKASEAQRLVSIKQAFDSTFFMLFESFKNVTNEVSVSYRDHPGGALKLFEGDNIFDGLLGEIQRIFIGDIHHEYCHIHEGASADTLVASGGNIAISASDKLLIFKSSYWKLYQDNVDFLGQYFRTLYIIMRYIANSDLDQNQKAFYFKFIRAHMSSSAATMIALNCLSNFTTEKFNGMVVSYGMLKNAKTSDSTLLEFLYTIQPEAFGREKSKKLLERFPRNEYSQPYLVHELLVHDTD